MAGMRKPKRTRAEKAAENRQKLLHAAADVVGQYGYAEASVARIVERAGLAQGTFYLYFESRQHLFDQLLPEVGAEALAYIRDRAGKAQDFITMEERGMRAFFDYVAENPSYFRIFTEAEAAAPVAYRTYTADRNGRFLDTIVAAWRRGEIKGYTERELAVLTQVMLASRAYLYHQYGITEKGHVAIPEWVIDTYVRFVARGIGAPEPERRVNGQPAAKPTAQAKPVRRPTARG